MYLGLYITLRYKLEYILIGGYKMEILRNVIVRYIIKSYI